MPALLGDKALDQIREVVRANARDVRLGTWRRGQGPTSHSVRACLLVDAITPADNPMDGATCCTVRLLRQEAGTGAVNTPCENTLIPEEDTQDIEVVVRSADVTGDPGTYALISWVVGEWQFVWVDCAPTPEGQEAVGVSSSGASSGAGGGGGTSSGGGTLGGTGGGYGGGGYGGP